MEKKREVRFLVGGGTIEEYHAFLERRKAEQPLAEEEREQAEASDATTGHECPATPNAPGSATTPEKDG